MKGILICFHVSGENLFFVNIDVLSRADFTCELRNAMDYVLGILQGYICVSFGISSFFVSATIKHLSWLIDVGILTLLPGAFHL